MAILNLKNVEVTRLNGTGNGVKVVEANEHGGKTYKTSYTLWFKEPSGLQVGDKITVSGFLGTKVGDPWKGDDGVERRSVELSVNSPRLESGGAIPAQPSQSSGEVWNTPGGDDSSDVPF